MDKMLQAGFPAKILREMPMGYALHEIICNQDGHPIDYIYRDLNKEFEKMTGMLREETINKKITEIIPTIKKDNFDWISSYGKIALEGGSLSFEEFFPPLGKWYRIRVFSPEKGFFITITEDITAEKELKTEFLETKKVLQRQNALIDIYGHNFDNKREWLDTVLSKGRELTESEHGYIFLYDEEREVLTLEVWTEGVEDACKIPEYSCSYKLKETGIWGEVIRQGKSIVLNDFAADHPLKKGYPEGHVQLKNYMSLPVFHNGKIVATVGMANKKTDYNELDLSHLTIIAQSAWLIYEDKKEKENREKELRLAIEGHKAVMLFIDSETQKVLYANPSALDFYGYSMEEILDLTVHEINMLGREGMEHRLEIAKNNNQNNFISHHKLKNGEIKTVDVSTTLIDYEGKKVFFSIVFDISDKAKALDDITYLAYHDHLTNAYNRRYFEELFTKLNKATNYPLAIILADINGLKLINDSYGMRIGDETLKKAAQEIKKHLPENTNISRISGDEFAIIFTQANEKEIENYTDFLEKELEKYVIVCEQSEQEIYLSVSFGYGIQTENRGSIDSLLKQAEGHLYRRKYYNSRSARGHMIKAMMSTLFQKSVREQKHSERVGEYSYAIGKAMNLSSDHLNKMKVAGSLHDIGKIGVDGSILNKPDKLDSEEWEIMKQHSAKGAAILATTEEYRDIAQIVASHHERWDGSGYPDGLKGEDIPFKARVIAVADAYDAMTNYRTYRLPLSKDQAVMELRKHSGSQFDPEVVNIFVEKVLKKASC